MSWLKWVLIGLFLLEILGTVVQIDQPRKPLAPANGVASFLLNGGLIVLLLTYWPEACQ